MTGGATHSCEGDGRVLVRQREQQPPSAYRPPNRRDAGKHQLRRNPKRPRIEFIAHLPAALDGEHVSAQTLGSAVLLRDREATAAVTRAGDGVFDDLPTHRGVVVEVD